MKHIHVIVGCHKGNKRAKITRIKLLIDKRERMWVVKHKKPKRERYRYIVVHDGDRVH